MEKSSKRGKIPQSDWPLIMARYEAGETLASIARTYDCSPPAISYVVSRSRTRQSEATAKPPSPSEPQLIKAAEAPATGIVKPPGIAAPPVEADAQLRGEMPAGRPEVPTAGAAPRRDDNPLRETNGFAGNGTGERPASERQVNERQTNLPGLARPAAPPLQRSPIPSAAATQPNGDQRRKLHLSLGNSSPANGRSVPAEHEAGERQIVVNHAHQPPAQSATPAFPGPGFPGVGNPPPQSNAGSPSRERDGNGAAAFSEARPAAYRAPNGQPDGNGPTSNGGGRNKDAGGSFIDQELRTRVDGDIAAFLAAFDAALVEDTQESRAALREATDRLLRAGARTRIELERLEARIPLPPRDIGQRSEPAWRHR